MSNPVSSVALQIFTQHIDLLIRGNAVRLYWEHYPMRITPNYQTFEQLHQRLCETDFFERHAMNPVRTTRILQIEHLVLRPAEDTPHASTWAIATHSDFPLSTVWRILNLNQLHLYHEKQHVQVLQTDDYPRMVAFYQRSSHSQTRNPSEGKFVTMSITFMYGRMRNLKQHEHVQHKVCCQNLFRHCRGPLYWSIPIDYSFGLTVLYGFFGRSLAPPLEWTTDSAAAAPDCVVQAWLSLCPFQPWR